jgi:hypothetical protein
MTERIRQERERESESFNRDLNPNSAAGQNRGLESQQASKDAPSAFEMKDLHERLSGFTSEELRRIQVLPSGTRLEQGATYVDLNRLEEGEFKARGDMEAGPDGLYVPKSEVDYQLWNRLIGVENPERTGDA